VQVRAIGQENAEQDENLALAPCLSCTMSFCSVSGQCGMLESHHHATAIQPLRSAPMIWLLAELLAKLAAELAAGFSPWL